NKGNWKRWDDFILFYLDHDKNVEAAVLAKKGYKKFPSNYNIGLSYAKALVSTENYSKAIAVLESLNILPFEHASESKKIYDHAHIYRAKQFMDKGQFSKAIPLLEASKEWPENLGVGAPFNPDTRMADYLLGLCHEKLQNTDKASSYFEQVADYRNDSNQNVVRNSLFKLMSLGKLDKEKDRDAVLSQIQKESEDNQTAAGLLAVYDQDERRMKEVNGKLKWDSRFLEILKFIVSQQ
ncbi:MAG: tetratricopeptide repeat protein, partial [Allomuricauda sp.]